MITKFMVGCGLLACILVLIAYPQQIHAQSIANELITHEMDENWEPGNGYISGSQNVDTLTYDSKSGDEHFRFTAEPNMLPVFQIAEASATATHRQIELFARSPEQAGSLLVIVLDKNGQQLAAIQGPVRQSSLWTKYTGSWSGSQLYFDVRLSGTTGVELDAIRVRASKPPKIAVYIPLLPNSGITQ